MGKGENVDCREEGFFLTFRNCRNVLRLRKEQEQGEKRDEKAKSVQQRLQVDRAGWRAVCGWDLER